MDMWVGARSAWHSKSLERRSRTYFSGRTGCYFTRCALIRTDDRLLHMQFRVKHVYLNRDAATKKMKRANEERCRMKRANEDQEETDERRKMPFFE